MNSLACTTEKSVGIQNVLNDTWCQCYITFFSLLLMARPNKLKCLQLVKFSSLLQHLLVAPAYPTRKHCKAPPIGFAVALPHRNLIIHRMLIGS
jgi:hypothetical protein